MAGCGGISDGEYTASVVLTGGSGKAHIESPCKVTVEKGSATADIFWSSKNYDYMIVGDKDPLVQEHPEYRDETGYIRNK